MLNCFGDSSFILSISIMIIGCKGIEVQFCGIMLGEKGRNDEEEFRKEELDVPDARSDDRHLL